MSDAPYSPDPNTWEIRPGLCVGDLSTVEMCENMVRLLDMDRAAIMGQIAAAEAGMGSKPPGWRTRAQGAMVWKKRVRRAVGARMGELRAGAKDHTQERRKLLLRVIYDELGEEEFARLAAIAEARRPELFAGGDHAG